MSWTGHWVDLIIFCVDDLRSLTLDSRNLCSQTACRFSYDIWDDISMCAQKLTLVGLIYRTEPKTEKWEKEKKRKSKNGYAQKYRSAEIMCSRPFAWWWRLQGATYCTLIVCMCGVVCRGKCPSIRLSHAGTVSKRLDRASWFWARRDFLPRPTTVCYKESRVSLEKKKCPKRWYSTIRQVWLPISAL